MLVFEERGKPEYPEKNLSQQSRELTNSPTYDAGFGNRTRDTLVEGERSHHCANPAPPKNTKVSPCEAVPALRGEDYKWEGTDTSELEIM